MIIKFDEFLNEFHSYSGPNATLGFKYSEPTNEYSLTLTTKYVENLEDIVKSILDKYNIPYKNIKIDIGYSKSLFSKTRPILQVVKIDFLSYSGYEAYSIINYILSELSKNNIYYNPNNIIIHPDILPHKKNVLGYRQTDLDKFVSKDSRTIGFVPGY